MPINSIIGLALLIWALRTLVVATNKKDRDQIIRASSASCIAALILALGYIGR